jgi:hypothetical protein
MHENERVRFMIDEGPENLSGMDDSVTKSSSE